MNIDLPTPSIHTLAQLRADLPVTQTYAYFQTGTFGPLPLSTQRLMAEALRLENEEIIAIRGKEPGLAFYRQAEAARQALACLLGVDAADVAWTYNTTTATRLAVASFDWRAGDRLAISDVEHLSTRSLADGLKQRWGVETTVVAAGAGPAYTPGDFLDRLDRALTPDHRLLILSHVANIDGRRLPVAEAVQLARARGVKTLVDGAQAVGAFPVNLQEIGADFYSGSAHKWLLGPAGVGFLVVSRAQRPFYNPYLFPTQEGADPSAGQLSEPGTANYTLRLGAGCSIAILQQIGLAQIEAQTRSLSERLHRGLAEVRGVRLAGPTDWSCASGIITLQLAGGGPAQCHQLIARLLDEHQIVVKFRPEVCGVRVTLAAFNTAEEVDRLLAALARLVPLVV